MNYSERIDAVTEVLEGSPDEVLDLVKSWFMDQKITGDEMLVMMRRLFTEKHNEMVDARSERCGRFSHDDSMADYDRKGA